MFCRYRNILGEVGKGVHQYRILNVAIVDVFLTILLAFIINQVVEQYSYIFILSVLFVTGIIMHRIFCVRTTVDKILFNP
jgi:hypothetical protein